MEFDLSKFNYKTVDGKLVVEEKNTFKEWVDDMCTKLLADTHTHWAAFDRATYAFDRHGNISKAVCKEDDEYSMRVGVAIAYARLKRLSIPAEVTDAKEDKLIDFKRGEKVGFKSAPNGTFGISPETWNQMRRKGAIVVEPVQKDGTLLVKFTRNDGRELAFWVNHYMVLKTDNNGYALGMECTTYDNGKGVIAAKLKNGWYALNLDRGEYLKGHGGDTLIAIGVEYGDIDPNRKYYTI